MNHQDRDRLVISLVLALVIHGIVVVGLTFADWDVRDFPEHTPVFVELLEYQSVPTEPELDEPVVEEPAEPEVPPEPPVDEQLADTEPAEPEVEPPEQPVEVQEEPQPVPEPVVARPPEPASPEVPAPTTAPARETPPEDHSYVDPLAQQTEAAAARERSRPAAPDLFDFEEPSDTGELPAWVEEGAIQPLSSLEVNEQSMLADKEETVPGFQDRLDQILRSLSVPENVSTTVGRDQTQSTSESNSTLPGNVAVQWFGGGSRSPVGALAQPYLLSEDFDNDVPASVVYVVVFEVNSDGLVVPGSLILRQSSGYTAADQKVHRAVSAWRFEPAPGTPNVTAIGTLVIERDDLR